MAGKSDFFETAILDLIFQGVAIADIAENDTTTPLAQYFISLHTADPGEGGTQLTSEATYGAYARVAVTRTAGGWAVTSGVASPVADITFPQATSGSNTITHAMVGTLTTGAGVHLFSGTVTPNITVTTNVTPRLTTASTITED
jgi:hypothetical protein